MKPQQHEVIWGLIFACCAFVAIMAMAGMHSPADFEAPGLKFVSPGISIPSR